METREDTSAGIAVGASSPSSGAGTSPLGRGRVGWAWAIDVLCAVVLPIVVIAALYLLPFLEDRTTMPFGFDTPGYLWRASVVQEDGVMALAEEEDGFGMRPGHPVVVATLMGITGSNALTLAWVMPAVSCAIIALAAGALASDGLKEPRRRALAYGLAVAGSSFLAWTAVGYASNLLFDPIALALGLAAILAAFRGRAVVAGALLVVGAALIHWVLTVMIIVLLIVFGAALGLGRMLRGRWRSPEGGARRVLTMVGCGVGGAAAALFIAPELPAIIPTVEPGTRLATKATTRLPSFRLWLTIPLAAIGSVLGMLGRSSQRRWAAALLGAWAMVALLGVIGWYVLELATPPYRTAGFAIVIPLSIVLIAGVVGDQLRSRGKVGAFASVCILTIVSGAFVASGASVWFSQEPQMQRIWFRQLETVQRYVETTGFEGPVALTFHRQRVPTVRTDTVRAALPRDLSSRVAFRPVTLPLAGALHGVPPEIAVVYLSGFDGRQTPPGITLAPGVVLLQGPEPPGALDPVATPAAPPVGSLVGLVLGTLVLLGIAGSGWTGLMGTDPVGRIALAPTFGLALLAVAGPGLSRVGVGFDRPGAAAVMIMVTVTGWIAHAISQRSRGAGAHVRAA